MLFDSFVHLQALHVLHQNLLDLLLPSAAEGPDQIPDDVQAELQRRLVSALDPQSTKKHLLANAHKVEQSPNNRAASGRHRSQPRQPAAPHSLITRQLNPISSESRERVDAIATYLSRLIAQARLQDPSE